MSTQSDSPENNRSESEPANSNPALLQSPHSKSVHTKWAASPSQNPPTATELAEKLADQVRSGSTQALGELFTLYGDRLRKIVQFRLDYRLASRISAADVLQDAFLSAERRMDYFRDHPSLPAFLWLRMMVGQQLVDLHRQHLGAEKRDARREVNLEQPGPSAHTSVAIAAHLVGQMTSVSEIVSRKEQIQRLESVLNEMDDLDREVIALRHFEELTNAETAEVLGIEKSAASKRYLRAMARLSDLMQELE